VPDATSHSCHVSHAGISKKKKSAKVINQHAVARSSLDLEKTLDSGVTNCREPACAENWRKILIHPRLVQDF
jgi:hypothetical protein